MRDTVKFRSRIFIILLMACFASNSSLTAQEGSYTLNWKQNESTTFGEGDDKETVYHLNFEGAYYSSEMLPIYSTTFQLNNNSRRYSITNSKWETIPDSILEYVELPSAIPADSPRLDVFGSGKSIFYMDVNLVTVRKNPDTNEIERLREFTIVSVAKKYDSVLQKTEISGLKSAQSSVLGSGYWYKIKVKETGIYKLSFNQLREIGLSDPSNTSIFGNGGRQLSYSNSDPRPEGLTEVPIYMSKGGDGVFNEGDYILFFAQGSVLWDYDSVSSLYRQKLHGYSSSISYFITDSQGSAKLITQVDNSSLSNNTTVNSYDGLAYYEKELINVVESGRSWYSKRIDGASFDTTFTFPNIQSGETVKIEAKVLGRNKTNRTIQMKLNDELVVSSTIPYVDFTFGWYLFGKEKILPHQFIANDNSFNIEIEYFKQEQSDQAYVDYITVNYRSEIKLIDDYILFRDINSVGVDKISEFDIKNSTANTQVWDVSDLNNTFSIKGKLSSTNYSFKASSDELREYIALNVDGNFPSPLISNDIEGVGVVKNQNLRSMPTVNYIIVCPKEFTEHAERLADYRRTTNNLTVEVVDPEQIYNEFSSGTPDVSAIRDFLRHQYWKKNGNDSLQFVLLFGDGSYVNHINTDGNTNYIPTFQSAESLLPTKSYTSDDFFGLLHEDEGEVKGIYGPELVGKLDIGIGRFPVKLVKGSDYEARTAVDKIISYDSSPFSSWRQRLCFVADDQKDPGGLENETGHMRHANELANYVLSTLPGFEVRKVFLDAYPQVSTASGEAYPDVNQEIQNLFEKGLLLFCYSGHGSENQITGELILQKSDLQRMTNGDVLPLFITATCSFSRYDHVKIEGDNITAKTSAGEEAFLNPDGGAVALLTTSRVVYGNYNQQLALAVLSHLFSKNEEGEAYSLGEVIRLAKNKLSDTNKLNFVLLGDPAMVLKYPQYQVFTDSVNYNSVENEPDTLEAFGLVTITGFVAGDDSGILSDFNGFVYPQVYDKAVDVVTFGNDDQPTFPYTDQKNLLYRGKATVTNGRFKYSFVVPKDIAYNIGKGKITYYAENGVIDAKGEFQDVYIGGTSEDLNIDNDGPQVELFMNDDRFEDGGMTNTEPFIYAKLSDENGINTTGIGIGHDVVAVLDETFEKPYVLNDYYEAEADDYTSGVIRYQLKDLEDGYHNLFIKVWDVFNNSAQSEIGFVVESSDGFILEKVINYPNPAQTYTRFSYTHNVPDEIHEVQLEVFDLSGRKIMSIQQSQYESGFVSEPLYWNFQNSNGANLGPGLYPYRLIVTTSKGTANINQKLIILR